MDRLLTNRTSAWFLWVFGKEQQSVTASRGVSLMPQLKTAKPAGPWSTVSYFTCFKVALITWPIFTHLLLKGPSFGAISLKGLNLSHSVLFLPKVNQHNEPRSRLSKSHWQDLYIPFKWKRYNLCDVLVSLMPPSPAVLLADPQWTSSDEHTCCHMKTTSLLKLCWESERGLPCQRSTSNWHSETQISSLELSPSCHYVMQWRCMAWCLDTHGFIPKIQWHIHVGPWSLVNWWHEALMRHYIRAHEY